MTRNEAKRIRANIEKTATFADDKTALEAKWMYPKWMPGTAYTAGQRLVYDGKLYKVVMSHTSQADWIPGVGTESLYERIDEVHDGTKYDPIPYDGNMTLEEDKYYTQGDVLYICTRTLEKAVHPLNELVGLYVNIIK